MHNGLQYKTINFAQRSTIHQKKWKDVAIIFLIYVALVKKKKVWCTPIILYVSYYSLQLQYTFRVGCEEGTHNNPFSPTHLTSPHLLCPKQYIAGLKFKLLTVIREIYIHAHLPGSEYMRFNLDDSKRLDYYVRPKHNLFSFPKRATK